jgi:hypothetical protein
MGLAAFIECPLPTIADGVRKIDMARPVERVEPFALGRCGFEADDVAGKRFGEPCIGRRFGTLRSADIDNPDSR